MTAFDPHDDEFLDDFLHSRGCALWMNWDVTDDKERAEAVAWIKKLFVDLEDFHYALISQ